MSFGKNGNTKRSPYFEKDLVRSPHPKKCHRNNKNAFKQHQYLDLGCYEWWDKIFNN